MVFVLTYNIQPLLVRLRRYLWRRKVARFVVKYMFAGWPQGCLTLAERRKLYKAFMAMRFFDFVELCTIMAKDGTLEAVIDFLERKIRELE